MNNKFNALAFVLTSFLMTSVNSFAQDSAGCDWLNDPNSVSDGMWAAITPPFLHFFEGEVIEFFADNPADVGTGDPPTITLRVGDINGLEVVDTAVFPGRVSYQFQQNTFNALVDVWLSFGNATWFRSCTPTPRDWVFSDLNGDNKSDLIWRNQSTGQNRLWLMDGPKRETAGSIPAISPDWSAAGTGDFNKDGKVDIYWRNNVSGINRIWFMDGLARTGFERTLRMIDPEWQVAAVCDLNNDGNADIVWRNTMFPQTRAWIMDGATQTDRGALPLTANTWSIAGCADFDGDGNDDLLWRNASNGQNRIWLMDGTVRTSSGSINIMNNSFRVGGVGDFTGDGKADILFHNDANGQSRLWSMDGLTRLSGAALPRQNTIYSGTAIGDYGGDGKLDIFWRNNSTGKNQIWNMDGASRMSINGVVVMPTGFAPMP